MIASTNIQSCFFRVQCFHCVGMMGMLMSLPIYFEANARPLSEWERFKAESTMAAYLNGFIATYIDPSIFHLSIQIQGEVNSEAKGKSMNQSGIIRGKELDPGADEDEMEMLPALPFYNKRIQKTKEIRAEQSTLFPEEQSPYQVVTTSGEVITIDRITVNLLFDSLVNEKAIDFITSLIQKTIGLDEKRGDAVVVQLVGFPDRSLASLTNRVMDAHLRSDSTQHARSMLEIRRTGLNMAYYLSIALLAASGLMFWALIRLSKSRETADVQSTLSANTTSIAPQGIPEAIPQQVGSFSKAETHNEVSGNFSHHQWVNSQKDQAVGYMERVRVELEEGIVKRPEGVAFVLDSWVLETETAIDQILYLMGPRKEGLVTLLSRWMSLETVEKLKSGLKDGQWRLLNPERVEATAKECLARFSELESRGRLAVLHHIDLDLKVRLIEESSAEHAWFIVFSLPEDIRPFVFQRIAMNTAFGLIRASSEIPEPNAQQLKSMEWDLITQMIQKSGQNDARKDLLHLAEELMQAQPMTQQSEFLERLAMIDADLAMMLRSNTVLWSDLDQFDNQQLAEASRILTKEELLYIITIEEHVGKRILAERPEREQAMLWEMAQILVSNPEKQSNATRRFLKEMATMKKFERPEPMSFAA